jgi:hypothetical protein
MSRRGYRLAPRRGVVFDHNRASDPSTPEEKHLLKDTQIEHYETVETG